MRNAPFARRPYEYLGVKLCYYILALERGDIVSIQAILHEAEQDAVLEQMVVEVHRAYRTEEDEASYPRYIAYLRSLLR